MPKTHVHTTAIEVSHDNNAKADVSLVSTSAPDLFAGWFGLAVKATLPDGTKLDEIVPVRFKFDDGRLSMQSLNVGGGRYPEILRLNADGELFDENKDA